MTRDDAFNLVKHLSNDRGVYEILHRPSDQVYIGSSQHVRDRCYGHFVDLLLYQHPNRQLSRLFLNSSMGDFEARLVHAVPFFEDPTRRELIRLERYYQRLQGSRRLSFQ